MDINIEKICLKTSALAFKQNSLCNFTAYSVPTKKYLSVLPLICQYQAYSYSFLKINQII